MDHRENGEGRPSPEKPALNPTAATTSNGSPRIADDANVVDLEGWLLAHGRWAAWEAERSTWAPEWAATRDACTGICTCWGPPLGGQP